MKNMFFLSIIFLTGCTSINHNIDKPVCKGGSIHENLINIRTNDKIEGKENLYFVEITAPNLWRGNKLTGIEFSRESSSALTIYLQLENFKDDSGIDTSRAFFLAEKEWLNGDYCIKATYLENIDGVFYVREAMSNLLIKN